MRMSKNHPQRCTFPKEKKILFEQKKCYDDWWPLDAKDVKSTNFKLVLLLVAQIVIV